MNDSIERIREDAEKHYSDYWGCDGRRCDECRANVVHEDCVTAKYIDLLDRAMRFMDERQLPEGVEWPRFEDGELVRIGDEVEFHDGEIEKVLQVFIGCDGYTLYGETKEEFSEYGTPVDRPEPEDTQEKIDDDATMPQVVYVACVLGKDARDMDGDEMQTLMIRDLLRRQRELCGRGAR